MTRIRFRGDTAANWTAENPTLAQDEPGVEQDTGKFKIGDGVTAWNSLAYFSAGGVIDHGGLTGLADDDHPQYLDNARGDARYDAIGDATAEVAAHEAASDPHPQYLTAAEGNAAYDATGAASAAQAAAIAAAATDATTKADAAESDAIADAATKYVPLTRTVNGHDLTANVTVTKSDVGLGNADNTSDANKPVSTATQTALDAKLDDSQASAFGLTLLDDADQAAARSTLGLGTLATQSGTFSGTSSGTNTGDQTITLTGDVTGTGTGSFAATLVTAQPAVHTWALAQTFTAAPIFTDQSGTRTALGLGTLATQSGTFSGTSSGTNTGDQTSIVGITGTLAQFNTALTGADFASGGGTATGTNTGDQTSIVGITGSLAEFNTALTGADFATGGGTVTGASSGTNTGDQTSIVGITGTLAQFNTALTDDNFAGIGAANSFTAGQTITPAANASALTVATQTHTASAPIINTAQTWNNSGVTFVGLYQNFVDTQSAGASLIWQIQLGSADRLTLTKAGLLTALAGIRGGVSGAFIFQFQAGLDVRSGFALAWANSSTDSNQTKDTGISRNAAGVVEVNNGSAGTFADLRVKVPILGAAGTVTYLLAPFNGTLAISNSSVVGGSTWYCDAAGSVVSSTGHYSFAASGNATTTTDVILTRRAAATLQHGDADAASPVAQTIAFQGARSGTDTNTAAVTATIQGSLGTGTGTVGDLVIKTGTVAASGTGAHTAATRLTINSTGGTFTGTLAASNLSGTNTGDGPTLGLITALQMNPPAY